MGREKFRWNGKRGTHIIKLRLQKEEPHKSLEKNVPGSADAPQVHWLIQRSQRTEKLEHSKRGEGDLR